MGNLSDDIIKYKKGELSPEQMHVLEKKALTDPFLADALEGIEPVTFQNLIDDISLINKKIPGKKKTILFTPLRIAAGVILVVASVFMIYQFVPERKTIALNNEKVKPENKIEPEKEKAGSGAGIEKEIDKKIETQKPKAESEKLSSESLDSKSKREEKKAINHKPEVAGKLNPAGVKQNEPLQQQGPPAIQPVQSLQDLASAETEKAKNKGDQANVELEEKANELVSQDDARASGLRAKKKESFALSGAQKSAQPLANIQLSKTVTGQVVSAEDGTPLPGVNVILKGSGTGTVTDGNGKYSLSTELDKPSLVFSFIGLQQQEVEVLGRDKIDVTMKEDVSQLSEVVVTGVGKAKDDQAEPVMKWAEPDGGRKAYDHYLESNVRYPEEALKNKVKGKAGIEFTVGTDGSLSEFRVIKQLGFGCEEEIVRLVKEGPRWNPTTEDDKPVESIVRIRLRFDPAKKGK